MLTKKFLLGLTLGIFTVQGAFMPVLATRQASICGEAPPLPAKEEGKAFDEAKKYQMLSEWLDCKGLGYRDLVNLKEPGGVNWGKVKERQKLIRTNNSINLKTKGKSEVTSDIINLAGFLAALPRAQKFQDDLDALTTHQQEIEKKLMPLKKKWFKSKSEKLITNELSERKQAIETEIAEQERKKSSAPSALDKGRILVVINGLKEAIIDKLGEYGLTKEILESLPPQV